MDKENLEFLKERLYFLGFNERLNGALEQNMKNGKKEFQLGVNAEVASMGEQKKVNYVLDFAKSDKQDRYFLNGYTVTLKNAEDQTLASQKVLLNYGAGPTSREAFNLLEGRSVHKKLKNAKKEPYEAWIKLDFTSQDKYGNNKIKYYNDRWHYDVSRELHKLPIKELQDSTRKDELLYKMRKGDLVEVNFVINKEDVKRHIAANPADRNVLVYDEKFQLLTQKKEAKEVQNAPAERNGGLTFDDSSVKTLIEEKGKGKDKEVLTEGKGRKTGKGI